MKNLWSTIKFLRYLATNKVADVRVQSQTLSSTSEQQFPLDVYQTNNNSKGHIVFIHGMNKYGNRDERVIHFCRSLAAIGFRVYAPTYERITNLLIDHTVIDDIEDSLQALRQQFSMNSFSVFSASYSGCMALKAMARPSIAQYINAYGTIGSPNRFTSAYAHALGEGGSKDVYAKLIFLRALLQESENYDDIIDRGMVLAIDDANQQPPGNRLLDYLSDITTEKQQQLRDIVDNIADTQHYLETYQHIITRLDRELIESADLRLLDCRVALIHSASDDIFRIEETESVYAELQQHGIDCQCLITPLLEHVDHNLSIRQWRDVLKMVNIMGYFLQAASKR